MKKIIVDSCCDLTPELKDGMGITSVPLTLMLGDREFCDDGSLDLPGFMGEMKGFAGQPGSAAPPPYLFKQAIEEAGGAYVITLSAKLSATYSNAVMGKQQAEDESGEVKAHIFDSKSASAGEALVAIKLFELVSAGLQKSDIIETLSRFINNMKTYFVLENFDNLRKSGRMSRIQGSLAQLLNFKLIAGADGNGEIALYERCRGLKQMMEKLLALIGKGLKEAESKIMVIAHCNNRSMAEELKSLVKERFSFKKIYIVPTGGLSSLYADDKGIILAF